MGDELNCKCDSSLSSPSSYKTDIASKRRRYRKIKVSFLKMLLKNFCHGSPTTTFFYNFYSFYKTCVTVTTVDHNYGNRSFILICRVDRLKSFSLKLGTTAIITYEHYIKDVSQSFIITSFTCDDTITLSFHFIFTFCLRQTIIILFFILYCLYNNTQHNEDN